MKPSDFIGLPVVNRIPGPRYGEKLGSVLDASFTKDGLEVQLDVGYAEYVAIVIPRGEDGLVP